MMKKLSILFAALVLSVSVASAETADSILKTASSKLTSSKGTTATFTISDTNAGTAIGTIYVAGNKFALNVEETTTVFDGETQWTISHDVEEISMYDPTAEELQQINPLEIVRSYSKFYTAKLLSSTASGKRVELKPKSADNPFSKIVITFDSTTLLPTIVNMTLADGGSIQVNIKNLKLNESIPASRFTVNTKSYPSYEVIDMR